MTIEQRRSVGWLRRMPAVGPVRHRLVCLPHAGGSWLAFVDWPDLLPQGVELIAVQYPGRQDRLSESCLQNMDEMADQLTERLAPLCDLPMSLFGHSMGSAVSYEVARRLERDNGTPLRRIFVSARTTPHRQGGEPNHRLPDADLIEAIRALGEVDSQVYRNVKLWPVILPPLRADLQLLDGHRPRAPAPLRVPITAFGGDSDHTCSVADLAAWAEATTGSFDLQLFPGGHHYLVGNRPSVLSAIGRRIAADSHPDRRRCPAKETAVASQTGS